LGNGVSNLSSTYWNHLASYYPVIPCGASDSLANSTGEILFTLPFEYDAIPATFVNLYSAATAYTVGQYTSYGNSLYKCILDSTGNTPSNATYFTEVSLFKGDYNAATTYQPDDFVSSGENLYKCILESTGNAVDNTTYFTAITRSTTSVNRYRGVEMPFGHIWKNLDGINIKIQADGDGGESQVWISNDPATWQDSNYTGYTNVGVLPRGNGYMSEALFGVGGEFMPKIASGGSTTYYCDYFYTSIPSSGESLRTLLVGGSAYYGAYAGFVHAYSNYAPSIAVANFGSRLCFLP
jgi:hypothetical protein